MLILHLLPVSLESIRGRSTKHSQAPFSLINVAVFIVLFLISSSDGGVPLLSDRRETTSDSPEKKSSSLFFFVLLELIIHSGEIVLHLGHELQSKWTVNSATDLFFLLCSIQVAYFENLYQ